jgi:hypothetical protein
MRRTQRTEYIERRGWGGVGWEGGSSKGSSRHK